MLRPVGMAGVPTWEVANVQITNCHIHTFTNDHVPHRFVPFPIGWLLRRWIVRRALLVIVRHFDRGRRTQAARYARIVEISYEQAQRDVFAIARGFYPPGTRFVVLPMDMTFMGAGRPHKSIEEQHGELRALCESDPDVVVPFAAVDPRHAGVVERTIRLIEEEGFRGIKLYPPLGYHPDDPALRPLYAYAEERGIPVLSHCSRRSVEYRGALTERMLTDPVTGKRLPTMGRRQLLMRFTDPDAYVPILDRHPALRLCLAHFGGESEWEKYLKQARAGHDDASTSWLAKILKLLRSGAYEHFYTDVSYTVFAEENYAHVLKELLSDERVRRRVLFGSDFYVVENAKLEERRRWNHIASVLGEDFFRSIAFENPREYLTLA